MPPTNEQRAFGVHSALSILRESPERVRRILFAEGYHGKRMKLIRELASGAKVNVKFVPRATLNRISKDSNHQGVVVEFQAVETRSEEELEHAFGKWNVPLILVLDGVQDPRNVGACLRCAEAAGVDAVLLGKNRSAPITDVVHRTSSGAVESLFLVQVSNLARRLDWLKEQGCWIFGTSHAASTTYSTADLTQPSVIVIGGEEKGLRALTVQKCDFLVSIPMFGHVESLNLSVATGVLLYEARRQRSLASD